MKNKQLEKQECKALAQWLRLKGIEFTHIANERQVPIFVGAEFKRLGVSRGFPDYFVFISAEQSTENRALGLFIEMKRKKKRLKNGKESNENLASDEQKSWIELLSEIIDIDSSICYGFDEAVAFIASYLK